MGDVIRWLGWRLRLHDYFLCCQSTVFRLLLIVSLVYVWICPGWLLWSNGRVIEVLLVVVLVFPLSLLRRMRSVCSNWI